ncbi:uncharacterized protein A4U43_C04F450 [Asparagus officinalis]|uniref:Uncharacterized protein n=1 Tax=Asparagus officinalis TaxID=4686 RepID=A0A5P1EXV1_ASPOF|nr:uncharacterized protein A4U43_C04F450 [Asparagus officinalis]
MNEREKEMWRYLCTKDPWYDVDTSYPYITPLKNGAHQPQGYDVPQHGQDVYTSLPRIIGPRYVESNRIQEQPLQCISRSGTTN